MDDIERAVDRLARESEFSGVVRIDRNGTTVVRCAFGLADRAHRIANTVTTRFGIASGTKSLTALTVMALVEDGTLALDAPARQHLRSDLPEIADDVTVEHLLRHRSGIGDYVDETVAAVDDHVLAVPVHQLAETEDYLAVLSGNGPAFPAGSAASYNNSGYVILALLCERAARARFRDLVDEAVCRPAGMSATGFPRLDEPAGDTATGYLTVDGRRTNVLHLPVRGSGDGGACSTVDDVHRMWRALEAGTIVSHPVVRAMTSPVSDDDPDPTGNAFGMGFHLRPATGSVIAEGYDAGVSFRSVDNPRHAVTHTVVSNTSEGAWPLTRLIESMLAT